LIVSVPGERSPQPEVDEKDQESLDAKPQQARQDREDLLIRFLKIETSLAVIDQKVVPISTALQTILVKELTHYHTPVMDELLSRIGPPSELSVEEESDLTKLLLERTRDMGLLISSSERDAAFILPAIMRRAKIECELLTRVTKGTYVLQFVAVENLPNK